MEINFLRSGSIRMTNVYRTAGEKHKELLNRFNSSDSHSRLGNSIPIKDEMTINATDIPMVKFGSEGYYKFAEAYNFNNIVSYKLTESEKEILDKLNNSNSYTHIGDKVNPFVKTKFLKN